MQFVRLTQPLYWDRGRPARNERKARKLRSDRFMVEWSCELLGVLTHAFAGETPAVPVERLDAPEIA